LIVILEKWKGEILYDWYSLSHHGLSAVTFDLVHLQPGRIDWFPSYSELKGALEIYGFQFKLSSNRESLLAGKLS